MGMKIYELADEAGINQDTLSDWERGKRTPQPKTAEMALAALDRLEDEMGMGSSCGNHPTGG
jgi:transcriptional regulator with XRE-family HTH domain